MVPLTFPLTGSKLWLLIANKSAFCVIIVKMNMDMPHVIADLSLDSLLEKVYQDGGYDFREYKRGTVTRRLARRLHASGASTYLDYMRLLDGCPQEYHKLADDITIKVSNFFRSANSFRQVARLALPELLSRHGERRGRKLRFWSAACARGEEPYSIAIMLAEFMSQRRDDFDVSIYATDISQWALDEAQAGEYSAKDLEGLPPHILREYFFPHGQQWMVRDDIRRMVHFSRFDLTSPDPPPFTDVDCIFCCNVLIYWQRQLQERVLNMLHGSLAAPGYLVLGKVETPAGSFRGRLECLDNKARIYKKSFD